jgi:hypothetical protein
MKANSFGSKVDVFAIGADVITLYFAVQRHIPWIKSDLQ